MATIMTEEGNRNPVKGCFANQSDRENSTVWRTAPLSVSSLGNVEKRYIKKNEKVSVLFFFEAFNNLLFQEYILYEFDVQSN